MKNLIQTSHKAFKVLTNKDKPPERVERKATDLRVANVAHGGWVAEVGFRSLLLQEIAIDNSSFPVQTSTYVPGCEKIF